MKKRITYWLLLCMSLLASKLMASDESSSPDLPLFGNEDSSSESEKPLKRIKKRQIQRKRKKTAKITFSDKPDYDPFVIKSAWEQDTEDEEAQGTPPPPPRSPSLLDSTIEKPNNNKEQRLQRVAKQFSNLRINTIHMDNGSKEIKSQINIAKNKHGWSHLRSQAIDALVKLEAKSAINDLRDIAKDKKDHFNVREHAIDALYELQAKSAIPILLDIYENDTNYWKKRVVPYLNALQYKWPWSSYLPFYLPSLPNMSRIKKIKDKAIQETENAAMAAPFGATLGTGAGAAAYAGAKAAQEVIDAVERTESYQAAQKKVEEFDNIWSVEWLEDLEKKCQEDETIDKPAKQQLQASLTKAKTLAQKVTKTQLFSDKKDAYDDFANVVTNLKQDVEKLNKQGHQITWDDPKLPPLPDLTITEDWAYYVVNKCKRHRRKIKLGGATAGVGLYYLALPYAAVFPRTSILIIGTTASAYVGKVLTGSYLNGWVLGIVLLTITGLSYVLFNRSLPRAIQQEEVKELVEAIKDEIKDAAAKAPIKPPKRFVPAPVQTKANAKKIPNNQGIQHPLLLIVLLGLLLGTFVFFIEKQRYRRRLAKT